MCDSYFFLVGRHFGLVGIEAFVEGLGLPLTWSMAALDVLLLLFSMLFANQIFTGLLMQFLCTFLHLLSDVCALFMHFLRTFYALFMHLLCACYALFMQFFRSCYAFFMCFLCALKKRTKSV